MKVYQVFVQDIWNNLTLLGFYKDLDDAVEDINGYITDPKFQIKKGDLKEYPSTFNSCFDTSVGDIAENNGVEISEDEYSEEDCNLYIRGFILDSEEIIKEINNLK